MSSMIPTSRFVLNTAILLAAALLFASCSQRTDAPGKDWPYHGGTTDEPHFSPLQQISQDNVDRLGLSWFYEFDTDRGQEATPIVANGRLYVSTAWSKVFAFDAQSGKPLWSFDPKVAGPKAYDACCDVVSRGVALDDGRVFVGALDGRLIALDATTGAQLWSVQTTDPTKPYTITGAPRVVKGKVIIGNSGAEYGVRGYVSAYDVKTGALVWRFYTVPPDPKKGPDGAASDPLIPTMAKTWYGDGWLNGGGGTVWDAIVYDKKYDQLYIGVGNGGPYNYGVRSQGKGDNLFLSSIVALNPDTGKYIWHYQEVPGESWDYTATQNIILTTLSIDGRARDVLMQLPKNGLFYVIDRSTGTPISGTPVVPVDWFQGFQPGGWRPKVNPAAYYTNGFALVSPGTTGVHSWHPMAFSPKTGLVYVPIQPKDVGPYTAEKKFQFSPRGWNTGLDFAASKLPDDPAQVDAIAKSATGELVAWDPIARKVTWRVKQPFGRNGGVLATAGGLVFQGTSDGRFVAYAAESGRKLWEYQAGNGIMAAPVSYELNGKQYVAVMAGFGGSTVSSGFLFPQRERRPGRLLVFRLDGKATAPAYPVNPHPALEITEPAAAPDTIKKGDALFHRNCMVCHGVSAVGGILPDLRRSAAITDKSTFRSIVIDGALSTQGMVSFRDKLTDDDAQAVRMYLQSRARRLAQEERPMARP
jgi:quinohemoprotein ethanol dehydrogenase